MSFFDEQSVPEAEREQELFEEPKLLSTFVGVSLPFDSILARTKDSALALHNLTAFPDGFEFSISSFLRGDALKEAKRAIHSPRRTAYSFRSPFDSVKIGLLYPNGEKVFLQSKFREQQEPSEYGIQLNNGGGDSSQNTDSYFAYPLPGDGVLQLVFEWEDGGVPESSIDLDASAITQAGEAAVPAWEDDRDMPSHWKSSMMQLLEEHYRLARPQTEASYDPS